MASLPSWLPVVLINTVEMSTVNMQELYSEYLTHVQNKRLIYQKKVVLISTKILPGLPYEESFYHLTTKEDRSTGTGSRLFDSCRSARLVWIAPVLLNSSDSSIKVWPEPFGNNREKIFIWLEAVKYVVVLLRRKFLDGGDAYYLMTAYCVNEGTKHKFTKCYQNHLQNFPKTPNAAP